VKAGGDVANVRYDAAAKRLYVAVQGGLVAFDPTSGRTVAQVKIDGHPESFQLERNGSRVFVNLPDMEQVVVADRTSQAVSSRWPLTAARANYPMALDETGGRLFVGCRGPAAVLVMNMATGKIVTNVPVVGDTDDLFYDAARRRVYVIGGQGFVDVLQRDAADGLRRTARVPTASGARTGLFVPDHRRLYVAVPRRGSQRAEVRVYDVQD
jgi:DNA-binding beta-propeller fold protein YncE